MGNKITLNNGLLDIHCHILPGLDEGASTIEETVNMLRIAKEDGICGIVAIPNLMKGVYDNTKETIGKAIAELRTITNGYLIYTGAEIKISRDLACRIDNNELPLINDKNYLLLELPAYVIPPISELENIIKGLKMKGITPIITHPERNIAILNDLSIMGRLIKCGVFFSDYCDEYRKPIWP